jgi:hypothetical protein
MRPKLTKVVYSGCLDNQVFVLFENNFYLILKIESGAVESFTLSEITEAVAEIVDVQCNGSEVLILTTEHLRRY